MAGFAFNDSSSSSAGNEFQAGKFKATTIDFTGSGGVAQQIVTGIISSIIGAVLLIYIIRKTRS